jgi:hypothetical protein
VGKTWITELPTLSAWNEVVLEFGLSRPVKMTGDTVIVPTAGLLLVIGTRILVDAGSSVCVAHIPRRVEHDRNNRQRRIRRRGGRVETGPQAADCEARRSTVIVALAGLNPGADALICTVPGAVAVP